LETVDIFKVSLSTWLIIFHFLISIKKPKIGYFGKILFMLFIPSAIIGLLNFAFGNSLIEGLFSDFAYWFFIIISYLTFKNIKDMDSNIYILWYLYFLSKPLADLLIYYIFPLDSYFGGVRVVPRNNIDLIFPVLFIVLIIYQRRRSALYFVYLLFLIWNIMLFTKGKSIFTILITLIIIVLISLFEKKKTIKPILGVVTVGLSGFLIFNIFFERLNIDKYRLLLRGYRYFLGIMMNFFNIIKNLLMLNLDKLYAIAKGLGASVHVRLIEIINILYYYKENFFESFIGLGLGGGFSIVKYPFNYNIDLSVAAYSINQINNNFFYGTHDSPSTIILKYGLVGIIVSFILVFKILHKNFNNNTFTYFVRLSLCVLILLNFGSGNLKLAFSIGYFFCFLDSNLMSRDNPMGFTPKYYH